jgi:8-oxo-dGTP diphosphatase
VTLIDVVGAIIVHDGRVLACRRRAGKTAAGLWEFPGGKVEPGESPQDALVREIREELAVDIVVDHELLTAETDEVRLSCWFARLEDGARLPTESTDHDDLRWMLPSQLPTLSWAPADLPAVQALAAMRWRS